MKVIKSIFAVFLTFVFVVAFDRLTQELFTNLSLNSVPSPTTKNPQSVEFPKDFSFGSASSAFQTEGAWNEDGKSASMWDVYTHQHPELVFDGSSADVGPNSYHFYGDDIEAVKSVGFQHYRFSVSWTRVMPNGSAVNQLGIKYYEKIIDDLIANNIEPIITIFHWDLPQFLQDLGGLTNPIFVDYYAAYADVLFKAFGHKVKRWITINEPYTSCIMTYEVGVYAPGIKSPGVGNYLCVHHLLMAHAAAFHVYDQKYRKKFNGQVGISLESIFFFVNDSSITPEEQDHAMQYRFGWFAHPIFGSGGYPQVMIDEIDEKSKNEGRPFSRLPKMSDELKRSIRGSSDFFGLNYYYSANLNIDKSVKDPHEEPSWFSDCSCKQSFDPSAKQGNNPWMRSVPEGLRALLKWIKKEYNNPPVLITETGWSDAGGLEDDDRVDYFDVHLKAVAKAINFDGCNVIGYTAWSLLDSYEWTTGYTVKYGLFNVNYSSPRRERTPKTSAKFWQTFLKRRKFAN